MPIDLEISTCGFEFSRHKGDTPRLTHSMRIAVDNLELERLLVVYPGERPYPLGERVMVVPLGAFAGGMGQIWMFLASAPEGPEVTPVMFC